MKERSLVLFKTDVVQRGIVGEVLHRFERCGLKIVGMKLVMAQPELVKQHYKTTDENLANMGNKTLADCVASGADPKEKFGSDNPVEIGRKIWEWNVEYLSKGPIIAIVFEGPHAVSNIRMLVGPTLPSMAPPGTIRGDFGLDSAMYANAFNRSIYNMVHASGNIEEADFEINLWFKPEELINYCRLNDSFHNY